MQPPMTRLWILALTSAPLLGCGSELTDPEGPAAAGGIAGSAVGSGGLTASIAGFTSSMIGTGGTGTLPGVAGAASGIPQGGSSSAPPSGGASSALPSGGVAGGGIGGADNGVGGTSAASGGTSAASGGTSAASGGTSAASGGTSAASGGMGAASGGTSAASGGMGAAGRAGGSGIGAGGSGIGGSGGGGGSGASTGGMMGPDGCSGLATNITLSAISVYQTVEVPVMKDGTAVAASARTAQIVAGRDAVFRLFVTLGSGWVSRSISGRVSVDNGGSVELYSVKKSPSASSTPADANSTFQIVVPKEKITPSTKYQVELVECGTASSGTPGRARFPSEAATSLDARSTGTLKIRAIPITVNGLQPDTSASALDVYKAYFLAMYPISSIEISVGSALSVTNANDWTGTLDRMRAQRRTDAPANDVYYYGLIKPAATFREFCRGGCTAGIGYVVTQGTGSQQAAQRVSLGLAYADAASAHTMIHEIGHNHGRNHAPCVPQGASISGVDSRYPHSGGVIGVYGWDMRSMSLLPPTRTDVMGYCDNAWMSDYTYQGILTRVAGVNGVMAAQESIDPALVRPWRVAILDELGARWGIPIAEPSLPSGIAEPAAVLDASGTVIEMVDVYRTEISDIGAYSIEVPEPELDWAAIHVAGAPPLVYPER